MTREIETFDGRDVNLWLDGLKTTAPYNVRYILALFALIGLPERYLDVGCGIGTMVNTARSLGVEAFGVDQLVETGGPFFHANLVNPFRLPEPVNLVTSFEVAEHLHESAHATFCDTLCENLKEGRGNYLVFSAATPGQGGALHLTERPAAYWHNEFSLRHLGYNAMLTTRLALIWSQIDAPLSYFSANVMVFEK